MKRLLATVLLCACSNPAAPVEMAPPTPAPTPTPAPAPADDAASAAKPAPAADEWDPAKPVDLESLETRTLFVTAPETSVCPTREQATARSCGNSVEFVDQGVRQVRGTALTVVGAAAIDGQWRAIRFQKAGTLPGWVRADDVGETPSLEHLDVFDARADVKKAKAADKLSPSAIRKLRKGALLVWHRHEGITLGQAAGSGAILFVPTSNGVVAVEVAEGERPSFTMNHDCVVNADCLRLSYQCEEDGYCDEVSLLARTTGRTMDPPDDPEGEWPESWTGKLPVLQAVAVADRFGLHEAP